MDGSLGIGELARRTGVAASALRYWEEIGLLPAPERTGGRRRYPPSAVGQVGAILLLRDVGFSLRDVRSIVRSTGAWRELAEHKIAELDHRIAQAQEARTAIVHALACPHGDFLACPRHAAGVEALLSGASLGEAHDVAHAHVTPPAPPAGAPDGAVRPGS